MKAKAKEFADKARQSTPKRERNCAQMVSQWILRL